MDFAALIVFCIVAILALGSKHSELNPKTTKQPDFKNGKRTTEIKPGKKLISVPSLVTLIETTLWFENRPTENSPDHKNDIMDKLVNLMWTKYNKYASKCPSSPKSSFRPKVDQLQYSFSEWMFDINDYELALNSLTIAMCECECQKNGHFTMSKEQCTRIFLSALHESHEEMHPYLNPSYKKIVRDILNDHGVANILSMKEGALTNRWAWAMNSRHREDMRRNIESQLYK